MILIISSFSVTRGNNLCSSTITVVINILNQYFVSLYQIYVRLHRIISLSGMEFQVFYSVHLHRELVLASFKAICNLLRKSALLCAD
jgi:hypothetical protein